MKSTRFVFRFSWGIAGLAVFGLALPVCILRSVKQRGPEFSRIELVSRPVAEFSIQVRSSDQPAGIFVAQEPTSSLPKAAAGSPLSNKLSLTRPTVQTNDAAIPTGFLQGSSGDPGQGVPGNGTAIIRMQDEDPEAAGGAGGASSGPSLLTIGAGVLAAAGVTAATLAIIEANNDPASP